MEGPHTHTADFGNNYTHCKDDNFTQSTYWVKAHQKSDLIIDCLIISIAFLGICITVCGLFSLVKTRHAASMYIINLFISDLIQSVAKTIEIFEHLRCLKSTCDTMFQGITLLVYVISVVVNICFMVCISAERYIMIAHSVWYRNSHTIRTLASVSVTVWIIVSVLTVISHFFLPGHLFVSALVGLLSPYPFVMFFFVGTWRALSKTTVPLKEQRRIIGMLALVLFIYTILFLPTMFDWFTHATPYLQCVISWKYLVYSANILMALTPLFDFVLYLIMRRDATDVLSSLFFCFNERHEDNEITEGVTEARV